MGETQSYLKMVKGFSRLTVEQQQFFIKMHQRHIKSMGTDNQKKYALENVKKVNWDKVEKTVNVYYEDNWWHYSTGGWY